MYSFSSHAASYGFQAFSPLDCITFNAADKRTDQNLSDFQTGNDAAAYATLHTQQCISYTSTALIDTIASSPGLDVEVYSIFRSQGITYQGLRHSEKCCV